MYKVLGYDELVPNERFARLINTRGEFQVGETVYKVSPRGTYYFPKSSLSIFEEHYADYEQSEGEFVDEKTRSFGFSIYRFDTFSGMREFYDEDDTKAGAIPNYNWNSAETVCGTASNVFENQIYYHTMSSNRRMKTRVYNHDYVVYQERGSYVKVQKKVTLGWKDMTTTGLGLGWNNIIMTKKYPDNSFKPLSGTTPYISDTYSSTFNGQSVSVAVIIAYSIPESDYDTIIKGNATTLRNKILSDTGLDIFGYDIVSLQGFDYMQFVFTSSYMIENSTDEVKVPFSNNYLGVSYKFVAGQFYYVGQDGTLVGTLRVGTAF